MANIGEEIRKHADIFVPSNNKKNIKPTCGVSPKQCFVPLAPNMVNTIPQDIKEFIINTYICFIKNAKN